MLGTELHAARCPYCGEPVELVIDASAAQQYVEDCAVCCRPLHVTVRDPGGNLQVEVRREDDV